MANNLHEITAAPAPPPLSITYAPRGQAAPPRPLALHPLHTPSPTHQLGALRSGPWKPGAPPCVRARLPLSPPHTGESSPEHTQRRGLSLLVPQTHSPPVLPPPTRKPEPPNCHERPPPHPTPRPGGSSPNAYRTHARESSPSTPASARSSSPFLPPHAAAVSPPLPSRPPGWGPPVPSSPPPQPVVLSSGPQSRPHPTGRKPSAPAPPTLSH
ncbi:proline-rich receptor-like protein kinase PERK2 [Phocoena sinus]|uniref:proline-rich receptor-like protein kinase PERK2 n=1 Tax=Phocoena sinus TaxID=42100 RepID=UPI0013C462F4|nr:proline-rich receptor-like protein kinase PERK2 [Phocoena sinus]XP_032474898.1 proline-rich receptor-like protein kinase PERK2 [Phocoena sinus]XP_032474902.1 proline-rich receptor-like protein kinase PERK2 [Phocoena sinus]